MPRYKLTIDQRFHTKYIINKNTACWEWNGALRADGYGILKIKGKCLGAHRYSYSLYKGEIPKGLYILHSCDNRKCVNPDHLDPGTQSENLKQAYQRGRKGNKKLEKEDAQ